MATITWEFFYTVETYHDLADTYNDVNYNENVVDFGVVDDHIPGSNKYIIKMHDEYQNPSNAGVVQDSNGFYTKPVAQTGVYRTYSKVPQKADIIYYVRFYMQKKINGVRDSTYWLDSSAIYDVKRNIPSENKTYIDFGKILKQGTDQANASTGSPKTTGGTPSKYPGAMVNSGGGTTYKFRATFTSAAAGKTLNPPFTMSAKFKPEDFRFPNKTTGGILNPDATVRTITQLAGVHPQITVTKAKLPTEAPATIMDWAENDIVLEGNPGLIGTMAATIVYDFCGVDGTGKKPRFYGVKTQALVTPGKKNEYLYEVVACPPGTDTSLTQVVKPSKEPAVKGGVYLFGGVQAGAKVTAYRKEQYKMVLGNCTTKAISSQNDNDNSTTTTIRPAVETELPKGDLRWNPPPHRVTSTESFGARMSSLYESMNRAVAAGVNVNPGQNADRNYDAKVINKFAELAEKGRYTKFEKLRIFQDSYGAKSLNRDYKKGAKRVNGAASSNSIWGFRATYNPTTFSYSTTANTDVDWTFGAKDPAILLAGNQTVTFDLYLNRIADMTSISPASGLDISYTNLSYPRILEKEEVDGIYNRGTEYDLEFLYRVVTGDPEDKNLLLSPSYRANGGKTSDLGYTTAVPCWLYLNENMRYYGSVAGITVNHLMFDLRMVPMLSVVTLTFARYPAADQGSEPKLLLEKQQGVAAATKVGK